MKLNQRAPAKRTHAGAPAKHISKLSELRRSLLSCLLWEREFYEDGETIGDRILRLGGECDLDDVAKLAIEARVTFKLRHAPLWLLLALIKRGGPVVSDTIAAVINRPDELTELVAMYWKDGKRPLSKQMKLGLAKAFVKFNDYQLAKWNKDGAIKLRDVMFLVHPKPKNKAQEATFKLLAENSMSPPNTWESRMTGGESAKDVFTDLLKTKKLGYMALLRNLRKMTEANVDRSLIIKALANVSGDVLPYRFIAAAKAAPLFERYLDDAMQQLLENQNPLMGDTILLVDVSQSMAWDLSKKSDLKRIDAANGLAILLTGICENIRVFTFSADFKEVPPRRGMALGDAIWNSQPNSGTWLGKAVAHIDKNLTYDRLIVITDEQSHDKVPDPKGNGYMINVASARNGIGYHAWKHIDGFSEASVEFIQEYETGNH